MRCHSRMFPLLLLAVLSLSVGAQPLRQAPPESAGFAADRLARLRQAVDTAVQREEIAGAVTLIARRGTVVALDAAGHADREQATPMRADTLFRIASMTKAVTSVAAMMLYEEGVLLLSDPVSRYIPAFEKPKVAVLGDPDANGRPTLTFEPARREMTIRDLLTHRSGLTYGFLDRGPVGDLYREAGVDDALGGGQETMAANIARLAAQPLVHQPGTRYQYGLSTDVLGHVVEMASGQTLDEFFRTRIFEPLRMPDTFFYVPDEKLDRLSASYTVADGRLALMAPPEPGDTSSVGGPHGRGSQRFFSGGAGLISTAPDYWRFLQMLLNGGALDGVRLLSPRAVDLMTVSHTGDLEPGPFGRGAGFGLGFMVVTDLGQAARLTSVGAYSWGGIFGTRYWVDPQEQLIGILMLQLYPNDHLRLRQQFDVLTYQALVR